MSQQHKALVLPTPDGRHEVRSVPRPTPAPGQVLVKVISAALNPADWKNPEWKTYWPESYPIVFGFDGAGVVEEVAADVTDFSKGDRVIIQGWEETTEAGRLFYGTFQQYLAVPTDLVAKIPENISFDEGATLFSAIATVANGLYAQKPEVDSLRLSPPWEPEGRGKYTDKSILVIGGATQVGLFAIQFAKLSGYSPIIATASPHNADLLKSYGATHVIDRSLPDEAVVAEVRAIAGGLVDLVYDAVSTKSTVALAAVTVREGGQGVFVLPDIEELLKKLLGPKGVKWILAWGLMSLERNKGALAGLWPKLPELLEEKALQPTKYQLLGGLEAVPVGLERLRRNEVSGVKLVVHPHDTQ